MFLISKHISIGEVFNMLGFFLYSFLWVGYVAWRFQTIFTTANAVGRYFLSPHYLETENISQPLKDVFSFLILHMDEGNNNMIIHPFHLQNLVLYPLGRAVTIPKCFHLPKQFQLTRSGNLEA